MNYRLPTLLLALLCSATAVAAEVQTIAIVAGPGAESSRAVEHVRVRFALIERFKLSDSRGLSTLDTRKLALCRDLACQAVLLGRNGASLTARVHVTGTGARRVLELQVADSTGALVYDGARGVPDNEAMGLAVESMSLDLVDRLGTLERSPPAPVEESPSSRRAAEPEERTAEPSEQREVPRVSSGRKLGLIMGAELGTGFWSANPAGMKGGTLGSFDLTGYGPAFTRAFDGKLQPALNLHIGWTFLDFFAFELALQTSFWNPGATNAGGAIIAGVRGVAFPFHQLLQGTGFEVSVELGGGYSFIGSSSYDMDGGYFSAGLGGEYRLTSLIGISAFYRLFTPFLGRFFVDYAKGVAEPVQGFTAMWNTVGVGVVLHIPVLR